MQKINDKRSVKSFGEFIIALQSNIWQYLIQG